MALVAAPTPKTGTLRHGLPASFKKEGVVYAITFDMDIEQLRIHYGARDHIHVVVGPWPPGFGPCERGRQEVSLRPI
jgi:hypothetical protein